MIKRLPLAALAATLVSACATQPDVPEALRPPSGEELILQLHAEGFQIYDCAAAPNGGYAWKFRAPEATLRDVSGKPMGSHYEGPTWRAADGSAVVGESVAKAPSRDSQSIPQLLLSAKRSEGKGVFSRVKSVQRLDTVGGLQPTTGCVADTDLARVVRVPYTATYAFYQ